jgi:hypothetical protein
MEIEIEVFGKGKAKAIFDKRNPITARIIYDNLPIEGKANLWLEEIYFDVPIKLEYENPSSSIIKGIYRIGRRVLRSAYFMENHSQHQKSTT